MYVKEEIRVCVLKRVHMFMYLFVLYGKRGIRYSKMLTSLLQTYSLLKMKLIYLIMFEAWISK